MHRLWRRTTFFAAVLGCGITNSFSAQVGQKPKYSTHGDGDWSTDGVQHLSFSRHSLPAVETILGKAGDSAAIAAQAELVHKSLLSKQKETEEVLLEKRKVYEQRLADQADVMRKVNLESDQLRHTIGQAKKSNLAASKNIQQLHKGNELLRSVVALLEGKMSAAVESLQNLVDASDNSEIIKYLSDPASLQQQVANTEHEQKRVDVTKLLEVTPEGGPAVLLQSPLNRAVDFEPSDTVPNSGLIIQSLADSLNTLAAAAAEGEKTLSAQFMRIAQEGELQHRQLLDNQLQLNQTLDGEHLVKRNLRKLEEQMLITRRMLNQRLHGLRVFIRRVDGLVDETTQQAASMGQVEDVDLGATIKEASHASTGGADQQGPPPSQHGMSPLSKAVAEATKEAMAAKEATDKATEEATAAMESTNKASDDGSADTERRLTRSPSTRPVHEDSDFAKKMAQRDSGQNPDKDQRAGSKADHQKTHGSSHVTEGRRQEVSGDDSEVSQTSSPRRFSEKASGVVSWFSFR